MYYLVNFNKYIFFVNIVFQAEIGSGRYKLSGR